jgi:molybdopterin biosynthesis enzyme
MSEKLIGYCMKTKQKEEFAEAEITKTSKGGYMAKGKTKEGHSMCAMLSEANALKAIKENVAKKGF